MLYTTATDLDNLIATYPTKKNRRLVEEPKKQRTAD